MVARCLPAKTQWSSCFPWRTNYRMGLNATVIGVTGSIGKTTTKDSLAKMLACRYRVHVTSGNFNNLIGMPLTILAAPADTEMLVLEMGMNATGEIARLTACARPAYAVITKVGTRTSACLAAARTSRAQRRDNLWHGACA